MKLSFGALVSVFVCCSVLFLLSPASLRAQTPAVQVDEAPVLDAELAAPFADERPVLPPLLAGLWENSRRVVSFESLDSAHIILKLFYGWYYDRAAEPGTVKIEESALNTTQIDYNYSGATSADYIERNSVTVVDEVFQPEDLPPRPKNDATSPQAQHLAVEFESLIPETETSGAWNIWISYPHTGERMAVPVAVFEGKLYVNFFLVQDDGSARFFQAASNTGGITVSTPLLAEEVTSYLVTGSRMYKIRYWQTDMDYDGQTQALLSGEDGTYEVPKHLRIGNTVYTCAAGRRTDIRNVEEIRHDLSGFVTSGDNRIAVQQNAYLTRMDEPAAELYQLIAGANSRRAPPPKPPIPPSDIDFHYDEIDDLRKYMIPQPEFPEFEDWEFIRSATYQSSVTDEAVTVQ